MFAAEKAMVLLDRLDGWETDALTERFIKHLRNVQPTQTHHFLPYPCSHLTGPANALLSSDAYALTKFITANVPPGSEAQAQAEEAGPGYFGMIENRDWNVGRIVEALHRLGLFENTHIMMFADHGEMLGSHGHFVKFCLMKNQFACRRISWLWTICPPEHG